MGDENQLVYIKKHKDQFHGPFLEVGSKDYGGIQAIRTMFKDQSEYVGADMLEGSGVDVVMDFTRGFNTIDSKLNGKRFGTIFCISVMEHCDQPFKMAENLTKLLKPGGRIYVSVPFSWKFHGFPSDYWRFTPQGVKKLFPDLEFSNEDCLASTSKDLEFYNTDSEVGKIKFSFKTEMKKGNFSRAVSVKILKALSRIGLLTWLAGYRYLLTPTMINMIGTYKADK